ncbi:MAG: geranylgeranyl pyrophosphate synthase, partial [Microbacteriaceae bacterium]|nr:geranylgeranyl pyrophosphate synthase [Microbacteriaceae bacterium]
MAESTRLVDLVQAGIDEFLDAQEPLLDEIGDELAPFIEYSRDLLRGGKRFRALFCYWGWQSVTHVGGDVSEGARPSGLAAVVKAASALEIFHAAALVHDDIMDNSDTRRGRPSAHKRFEALHAGGNLSGPSRGFGQSAALLLGDLLLGWSDELLDSGLALLPDRGARVAARAEFNRMRTEVTVGQYLDVLGERAWQTFPESEQLSRAHRVIV